MIFAKALLIWLLIIPLGILNGGLRIYLLTPLLGSFVSLMLSGIILSCLIFMMAYLFILKIGVSTTGGCTAIGAMWFILTNLFDIIMILHEGKPASDFLKLFDVTTGNLWVLVVIACLISPTIAAKLRGLI